MKNPDGDYFYSDEDKLTEDGTKRFQPHFKPDWSPDTLRSCNYPTHLSIFSKELIDKVGGFRKGFDGSQDYDLILRATEKAEQIVHIPEVLYHWRIHESSAAGNISAKTYAYDAAKKALSEHLGRSGLNGRVEDGLFKGSYQVIYEIKNNPKVSIIIPNKDNLKDLEKCINSIYKKSTYRHFEVIVIENNSSSEKTFEFYERLKKKDFIKIVKWDKSFNYAAVNNYAVNFSDGEILLFLNNDTEVINEDWLERMVETCSEKRDWGCWSQALFPG